MPMKYCHTEYRSLEPSLELLKLLIHMMSHRVSFSGQVLCDYSLFKAFEGPSKA